MEEYYLFTFETTHAAIATEKILKPVGGVVMPVPRFISSSCGISIRIDENKHEEAEKIFREKSKLKLCSGDDEECEYNYYHVSLDKPKGDVKLTRLSIK